MNGDSIPSKPKEKLPKRFKTVAGAKIETVLYFIHSLAHVKEFIELIKNAELTEKNDGWKYSSQKINQSKN
jgi:hypothetical protein